MRGIAAAMLVALAGCSGWMGESPEPGSSGERAPLTVLPPSPIRLPALEITDAPASPGGAVAAPVAPEPPAASKLRKGTDWRAGAEMKPAERVRRATADKLETVRGLFGDAGVPFPPAELLLRTFKQERELEVWASAAKGGRMSHVATYAVCAMSGGPGPKRREGDLQVPEGFYAIQYFWPESAFHLSANVGYPNASDRALGGPRPGGEIMIHGGCASIGCIAVTDERIQELYVMSAPLQHRGDRVAVHIFPARDMARLLASGDHPQHRSFWLNIKEGLDRFEADRTLPDVKPDWRGRYVFR